MISIKRLKKVGPCIFYKQKNPETDKSTQESQKKHSPCSLCFSWHFCCTLLAYLQRFTTEQCRIKAYIFPSKSLYTGTSFTIRSGTVNWCKKVDQLKGVHPPKPPTVGWPRPWLIKSWWVIYKSREINMAYVFYQPGKLGQTMESTEIHSYTRNTSRQWLQKKRKKYLL